MKSKKRNSPALNLVDLINQRVSVSGMRRAFIRITFMLTLVSLPACATKRSDRAAQVQVSQQSRPQLMKDAGQYITDLKKAGTLPGLAKDEDAVLHVLSGPVTVSWLWNRHVAFPASLTAEASANNDTSKYPLYVYQVTKTDETSAWHLDGAWKLEENGKRTEIK
jgi:hypothetical protein